MGTLSEVDRYRMAAVLLRLRYRCGGCLDGSWHAGRRVRARAADGAAVLLGQLAVAVAGLGEPSQQGGARGPLADGDRW